jgi:tight adherence protein B
VRRGLGLLAVVATAAALAGPARAADAPTLGIAAGARFPERSYVLTLPRAAYLAPGQVVARENGHPVPDLVVQSADGADAHGFGVVLAIDTSSSMRGSALRGAVAAARAFVAHRTAMQPVALVAFGGEVRVVLPFTSDAAAIDQALGKIATGAFRSGAPAGPPTSARGGSRLLDAAAESVRLVERGRLQVGSVVLLSDGSDQGSVTSLEGASSLAASAGVRIYAVGLRSSTSDFGSLNQLAAATHGEFSQAGSLGDLARLYSRLGSRLAHQYVLRYRSAAAPAEHVDVTVRVSGFAGVASTSYVTPAAPRAQSAPFHHSPGETLWLRPGAAVGVSIFAVALLGLALWVVLRPRGRSLRSRLGGYVGTPEAEQEQLGRHAPSQLVGEAARRSLRGAAWMAGLRERLDVGRVGIPAERLVGMTAVSVLALIILLPLLTGTVVTALLALTLPLAVRAYVEQRVRRQRRLFTEQLPDNLQVMASAMRAGHSFAGSLTVVAEEAPEPTRAEFKRVIADERLGVPVDQALAVAVRRMQSKELEQVALVAALQRETGGNTAEVLERVTETVRERVALRRMVKTLTAQGRISRWVLTALPIGLLLIISVVNGEYTRPLFTTPAGHLMLIGSGFMVFMGSMVIKRIVDIEV